uniref:Putative secreted protein n=1 Tax=Rhipicephalus microplus TaxID=6941 RepID=A0A6M2D9S6_RHIMP
MFCFFFFFFSSAVTFISETFSVFHVTRHMNVFSVGMPQACNKFSCYRDPSSESGIVIFCRLPSASSSDPYTTTSPRQTLDSLLHLAFFDRASAKGSQLRE